MTKTMSEAINNFMDKVRPWELSGVEKKWLRLAQQGNDGAFCELLSSQGLTRDNDFNAFYAEVNSCGE